MTRKGVIISLYVTLRYAADSPRFELLAKNIPMGRGIIILDSGYLSRKNCEIIEKLNHVSYIKPKKNSKSTGFSSMSNDEII